MKETIVWRDYLAADRTFLANERTFLAYLRTFISVFAAGIGFIKFMDNILIIFVGYIFIFFSIFIFFVGTKRYLKLKKRYKFFFALKNGSYQNFKN